MDLIYTIVLVAVAAGAWFFFFRKKMGSLQGDFGGGLGAQHEGARKMSELFDKTLGYRTVSTQTPQQMAEAASKGKTVETHMVRSFEGCEIHYRSATSYGTTESKMSLSWSAPPAGPLLHGLHIAEASLADKGSRIAKEMLTSVSVDWKPSYKQEIKTNDPELDERFRFFVADPEEALEILENARLKALLLSIPHVDLVVGEEGSCLNDPLQNSLAKLLGGRMATMQMMTDRGIAVQEKLHNDVAALLSFTTQTAFQKA